MRVFVAGATGAVGKRLVPQLIEEGHEVTAMTRSAPKAQSLRALGAEPAIADALDRAAVLQAVMAAEPEIVIHQLTGLAGVMNLRNFDREFATTNRLRTEGTGNLLQAALAVGARRFIAQSYCGWNYEPSGSAAKTESDPLDPHPLKNQTESLKAIRGLEAQVTGAELEGIVLRYGSFYGPGTDLAAHGTIADLVRKRRFPIIGTGAGIWSFAHVDDASSATVAALESGEPGIYNVVDDYPAPVSEWLPALAQALGAKPPRRIPVWLGRVAAGEVLASMMTRVRGGSNARAKRAFDWAPRYPTYREGFRDGLADATNPRMFRNSL